MKLSAHQLAQQLSASIGADNVIVEKSRLADHAVDTVTPALICAPTTVEQLATVVKVCAAALATMAPWGGGTAIGLGNPPRSLDVVIETTRLHQAIEHDPANLTVTVQSGIALNALQNVIAAERQFVPFDPPLPERSTIGGIVAANLNGPRRSSYGSVRDLVIGLKVVLASGEIIKAGGKVVKNVAGYDMCKLFTGSLGTLGIIAEVTLRVAPLPADTATASATGTLVQTADLAGQLARTKLLPTATFLLKAGSAPWQLAVSFDGFAETVTRQVDDLGKLAHRLGMTTEIVDGEKPRQQRQAIADLPISENHLVYRLTVPRGAVMQTISTIVDWIKGEPTQTICADMAMGTIWIVLPANRMACELFPRLIALTQQQRGHAVIFNAPAKLKQAKDVWGPATPAHGLMRKIKQEFDPFNLLNPGRFVGSL
ncbi:MAG TPA: FAD-binding oxidoreductase [Candidatus Limnocylindria bacterium]|nr:FAD-binding oxidoreductase [Candidatus Limnocylindria bacterium]